MPRLEQPEEPPLEDPRASWLGEDFGRAAVMTRIFGEGVATPKVGRFTLIERVGEGAMGTVWSAYDPQLDRKIALKVLHPAQGVGREDERVLREARMMASVNHPNVAHVYEVGSHAERIFIAMEFVAGTTLRKWQDGTEDWQEIVAKYVQAARGLAAAHRAGIVHRDFKPDNALVGTDGRVRVVDFGLAHEGPPQASTEPGTDAITESAAVATSTRHRGGTPAYMAPEQMRGEEIDARADQFAFCVALFEALSGERPYAGQEIESLRQQVERGQVPLHLIPGGVPSWIRQGLARGLRPEATERHPSMDALIELLERDPGRLRRRVVLGAGLGSAVLVAAILGRSTAHRDDDPCPAPSEKLDGIWNAPRAVEVRRAIEGAGPSFLGTATRVESTLDAYATAWMQGHLDACRATHVRHEQSEALLDARMQCLADRQRALAATVQVLMDADATVAENALETVWALPGIEACADTSYVRSTSAPPEDEEVARAVEVELERAAKSQALVTAGRLEAARDLSGEVLERAQALAYPPLLAKAEHAHGSAFVGLADIEAAERHLVSAYRVGRRVGDSELAGEASARLAYVLARHTTRLDEARLWANVAETEGAIVAMPRIQAAARNAFGIAAIRGEDRVAAGVAFREAVALLEDSGELDSLTYQSNLARYIRYEGRVEEAARLQERVLHDAEELLGPDHPALISYIDGLGDTWIVLGRVADLEPILDRGVAIALAARGEDHPDTAQLLSNRGYCALLLGKLEEAQSYLERALSVSEAARAKGAEQGLSGLNWLAEVYFQLDQGDRAIELLRRHVEESTHFAGTEQHRDAAVSRGELATGLLRVGRIEEALQEIEHATRVFEELLGPDHLDVSQALQVRAEALAASGREDAAVLDLERALQIRERALGPTSPKMAGLLVSLAQVRLAQRKYDEALAAAERAESVSDREATPPHEQADVHALMARALVGMDRDRPRAASLAQSALMALEQGPPAARKNASELRSWMREARLLSSESATPREDGAERIASTPRTP